jgi:ankyrin repeat protein
VAYLRQVSPDEQTKDQEDLQADQCETETDFDALLLEWADEKEEPGIFQPMALTEERHAIDPLVNASQALVAILQGFEVTHLADGAASDFWELYSQREGASSGHQNKPSPAIGTGAAAPSKKRLDTPSVGATGETTVLSILCSSRELLGLVPCVAGTSPVVCVALLSLISKLLVLRGGPRVLLELEKLRLNTLTARIDEEDALAAPPCALTPGQTLWPIDTETCSRSAHASLLRPLMAVLHSFMTSFDEVEAAVRVIAILTGDAETEDGKQDESSASEADWFVSCAVASGALGVLVAYLDSVRIPTAPQRASSLSDKLEQFTAHVEKLVMRFCNWGRQKQGSTARHDEQEQASQLTTSSEMDSHVIANKSDVCSFETLWAQQMLNSRFDIPRFGYSDYSALLLATEIGQTETAIALLNAGASADTTSSIGATLLMLATLNRDEVLINELIRHGADLNAVTTDGRDQTVWLCTMVSSSEAHKLISDTYTAAAASTCDSTADALPLLIALDTIRGSPVALHDFMRYGMDVNISDANGNFLLHAVLSKAHVRQKLRGIDLCFRYDSRLIGADSLSTLITALVEEYGADVHKANRLGQTPLHLALLYGHSDAARLLLQHGANPNVLDAHGYLPLHYACCGFCGAPDGSDSTAVDLIQLLLDASPSYPIVEGKHVDDRKFKTLSEKLGLEIEDQLREGLLSITQPQGIVTELASRDKVVHLASIADGFLPWHMTCGAFTHSPATLPLDDAMAARFVSNVGTRCAILMHFMDKCGVDIGKPAHKGLTALHLAIKSSISGCNDRVIEILLTDAQVAGKSNSLDINAVHDAATVDSLPPLAIGSEVTVVGVDPPDIHGFVSSRSTTSPDEYHILLSNGVHVEAVDRQRLRLADSSTSCNKVSKRYYLFIESCFTALHYALQTSDELSRRLLAVPDLSQKVEGIDIPFLALACAAHRSADVIKPLIGPSANMRVKLPLITLSVNFRTGSSSSAGSRKKHAAALHYAVMYEDIAVTRELVSSSHVNVNVRRSGDGFTPLHLACEIGNTEIIKLLLEHGADVGQESSSSHHDSVTPLLLLVKSGAFANDSVRTLVLKKCQDLHLLFGDFTGPVEPTEAEFVPDCGGMSEAEKCASEETTCFLIGLEHQNLQLHDRIQQLHAQHRVASDLLARKLEIDLTKLDGVLNIFFELLQSDKLKSLSAQQSSESQPTGLDATRIFARLPHPHECFRHYKVRSAWSEAPEHESNQANTVMEE